MPANQGGRRASPAPSPRLRRSPEALGTLEAVGKGGKADTTACEKALELTVLLRPDVNNYAKIPGTQAIKGGSSGWGLSSDR